MMRSLYSGVSGLRNHQTRMDVIGNNIANVNTVGFKASRTIFQDMYSQNMKSASAPGATTGGTNPQQIGLGVTLSTIDTLFTRSAAQVTGNTYDLMIENDGFFVVRNGAEEYYTRAGNFYFDKANNLVTASGFYLMGFKAYISPGTAGAEANPSTLDRDPAAEALVPSMKRQSVDSIQVTAGEIKNTSFELYDDSGTLKIVGLTDWTSSVAGGVVTFVNAVTNQEFEINLSTYCTNPANDLNGGRITFNNAGSVSASSTIYGKKSDTGDPVFEVTDPNKVSVGIPGARPSAYFTFEDDPDSNTIFVTQTAKDGSTQTIEVVRPQPGAAISIPGFGMEVYVDDDYQAGDLHGAIIRMKSDGNDAVAQGAPISTFSNSADNMDKIYVDPLLYNVTIDKNGKVYGIARQDGYIKCPTTGDEIYVLADQRVEIGQVVVSVFDNQQALEKVGDNLYRKTANTGEPKYNKAGENGSGLIKPGALEMSNVDLAQEFTDMIVTQRGFQANSRIITVSDTLLEELINLKR